MTPREFFDMVAAMRAKQKEYFRTRNQRVLQESKRLEKQVDAEIERAQEIIRERQFPRLDFGQ